MRGLRLAIAATFLENCGGMERVVLKIAQHFKATIHCMYYDPGRTFNGFSKLDVRPAGALPKGITSCRRMLTGIEAGMHFYGARLSDYDVVNAHSSPSEWIRNRNSPVIWYCHSPNREAYDLYDWRMQRRGALGRAAYGASLKAFHTIESRVVPKIEHIFANSRNTQGRIRKYLKRESELLHPGVDTGTFYFRSHENFFFYPSRFIPEKEHAYAIEAFRRFSKKNKGWKLVLCGALPEGRQHYLEHLRALSAGLPVEFEPDITEERLHELYATCYAALYTPYNEDFGLVPLEAMASRKVCIARDEAGPRETIKGGEDGFLVKSAQEMASKMEWLTRHPDANAKMGRAGRHKVEKKFTWEIFLSSFEQRARETAENAGKHSRAHQD